MSFSIRITPQFVRYLVVGGSSFMFEYVLFWALFHLAVPVLVANSIAYLTVFGINFILNRVWAFQSKGDVKRQMLFYLALLGVNLAATNAILFMLVSWLHLPALLAKIMVMATAISWNFVIYKKMIYR